MNESDLEFFKKFKMKIYCEEVSTRILQSIRLFIQEKGYMVIVVLRDGVMIPKEKFCISILDELNKLIKMKHILIMELVLLY